MCEREIFSSSRIRANVDLMENRKKDAERKRFAGSEQVNLTSSSALALALN